MKRKPTAILALTLSLLLSPGPGHAHGLFWSSEDGAAPTLMVGHHHSPGHGGEANHPLPVEMITACQVLDDAWRDVDLAGQDRITLPVDTRAARLAVDWGWWVKTRDGNQAAHPDSVRGVLMAWRTRESLLLLNDLDAPLPAAPTTGLALLPVTPLAGLHPGDKATFLVLFQGSPAADVPVYCQGQARGSTDSKGHIRLKLREAGPQQIQAGLRRPDPDDSQRKLNFNAQMDFTLEEK